MRLTFTVLFLSSSVLAQTIGPNIPGEVSKKGKYMFYLHGGVVTALGDMAINQSVPEWGPYEYSRILDSLRKRGFHVISEIRKESIHDSVYAWKIVKQVDSLTQRGAKINNMIVVGASAGWNITLLAASKIKNKKMKYVLMGGCWPETHKDYANLSLYGKFLSIIETTDPHGTCNSIFQERRTINTYKEIKLNTGLSHGFIYKGYKSWIDPIVAWSDD